MDAELGCAVSRNRLGFVSVVDPPLMEDMAECVDVACRIAMRGEGEVVGPIALSRRPDHVVNNGHRVIRGRLSGQRPGTRHRLPRHDGRRCSCRCPRRDEVESPELVFRSPSTPVRQSRMESLDLIWAHGLSSHDGTVAGRPPDRPTDHPVCAIERNSLWVRRLAHHPGGNVLSVADSTRQPSTPTALDTIGRRLGHPCR